MIQEIYVTVQNVHKKVYFTFVEGLLIQSSSYVLLMNNIDSCYTSCHTANTLSNSPQPFLKCFTNVTIVSFLYCQIVLWTFDCVHVERFWQLVFFPQQMSQYPLVFTARANPFQYCQHVQVDDLSLIIFIVILRRCGSYNGTSKVIEVYRK